MVAAIALALQSAAFYGLKADGLRSVLLGGDDGGEPACGESTAGVIADVWRAHGKAAVARLGESDAGWIADRLVRTDWRVELDVARSECGAGAGAGGEPAPAAGYMEARAVVDLLVRRPPSCDDGDKRITLSLNEAEAERLFHQLNAVQMQIDALE